MVSVSEQVFASGEWHTRADNWRDDVDLSTADRMTVYAAGRDDGYRQAVTEFREAWLLLAALDTAWDDDEARAVKQALVDDGVRREEVRAKRAARTFRRRHLRVVGA